MSIAVSPVLPYAVKYQKNGRIITLGKVYRQPNGCLTFGTPYANRPFSTPSLPVTVYRHLLELGVTSWIIRFDRQRRAYRIRLDRVAQLGRLTDEGELCVPLHFFEPIAFPQWPFAVRSVLIR
jgi:hypothetical protein